MGWELSMSDFLLCKLIISSKCGPFDLTVRQAAWDILGIRVCEENQDPCDNIAEAEATLIFDLARSATGHAAPLIVRAMDAVREAQVPALVIVSTSKDYKDIQLLGDFLKEHAVRSLNVVGSNSWDKSTLMGIRDFLVRHLPIVGMDFSPPTTPVM